MSHQEFAVPEQEFPEHVPVIVPFKFHGVPAKQFIADQLIQMGSDVTVHLWKEIPRQGHDDDPADECIDLSTYTLRAAVQVLDDYKLAVYKQARFFPHEKKEFKGQVWRYSKGPGAEQWRWKSTDRRSKKWKRTPCVDEMKEPNPLVLDDDSEAVNEDADEEKERAQREYDRIKSHGQLVDRIFCAVATSLPVPPADIVF